MLMHDYEGWGVGWLCDDIANKFFYKSQVFH